MEPDRSLVGDDEILAWLLPLDGVQQDPVHHPERDALYHSLQVFEHALADRAGPALLAAALLHDVGKAYGGRDHDRVGAELLVGLPERTVWLVAHHLDLLRAARATRARWRGTPALADLERLRRWDLAGRDPHGRVREPEEAAGIVAEALDDAQEHV
ncbi:MAG: HD domain-containing protein [Myxococcota bacterium]